MLINSWTNLRRASKIFLNNMKSFQEYLTHHNIGLDPLSMETLQVNLTKMCNQACKHCHVGSSPLRREMISPELVEALLILIENEHIKTVDLTGGAPELHSQFKTIIRRTRELGKKVIVRHNLTVTLDPHPEDGSSMSWLPDFFKEQKVELVSSLPYYREYLTDRQRGNGVFHKSITALKELNDKGFGKSDTDLIINLVFNPVGPYLPPPQSEIEKEYKKELKSRYGIVFNHLFTITNMPINRFKDDLVRRGEFEEYVTKLKENFNSQAALSVMCRNMISVAWDGKIYDCDFNQMLEIQSKNNNGDNFYLKNFNMEEFSRRKIRTAVHCFGCAAGAGSSCGGTTT